MMSFKLSLLSTIKGIGAASGLLVYDGKLLLISDSSNHLYECRLQDSNLTKTELIANDAAENIPKKLKSDFEAITLHDNELYIFGSGSTENRNKLIVANPDSKKVVAEHNLSGLYTKMKATANIGNDDFNIEGVANHNNRWYFFQRGNGSASKNGIFIIGGNITADYSSVEYKNIPLPNCNGIAATFTDGVIVNDKIWFIATAENSNSVYDDGEILGSIVGSIDIETMKIEFTEKISDDHKFEGIAFSNQTNDTITFLLCEDNDTEALESGIFQLMLKKS